MSHLSASQLLNSYHLSGFFWTSFSHRRILKCRKIEFFHWDFPLGFEVFFLEFWVLFLNFEFCLFVFVATWRVRISINLVRRDVWWIILRGARHHRNCLHIYTKPRHNVPLRWKKIKMPKIWVLVFLLEFFQPRVFYGKKVPEIVTEIYPAPKIVFWNYWVIVIHTWARIPPLVMRPPCRGR